MEKENKRIVNKNKSHPELDSGSSTLVVSQGNSNNVRGRFQIKFGMTSLFDNNVAFTLIELLVVVLIIAILAAVALPQYQKAVWKSRTTHLRTLQTALATAQDAYFMANGTYPTSFSELDLGFDNLTPSDVSTMLASGLIANTDTVRYNDLFEVILASTGNTSWFRTGKYKGCGLYVNFKTRQWSCYEWHIYYKATAGSFCQKMMGAGALSSDTHNVRHYPL